MTTTRKRIYGIVWNWQHNRRTMIDRLTVFVEREKMGAVDRALSLRSAARQSNPQPNKEGA